jgi:membrane associated rhomboid family serine protease
LAFRPNWYADWSRRGRGWAHPSTWSGFRWIFTLNVAAYLLQLLLPSIGLWGHAFEEWLALRAWWPPDGSDLLAQGTLAHGPFNWFFPVQSVTYAFLHSTGDFTHLGFNMLYLWFFAPELENELGRRGFLRLYLGGAVFGGLLQWAWWLADGDPGVVIGASGAVYTVMTLFALKWPHRQILVYLLFPLPIWILVVIRVGADALTFVRGSAGSVAVLVHLGGAAFGLLWLKAGGALTQVVERRRREKAMRQFQEESGDRREMDRILAKIQATGLGSLDGRERSFLERRSRQLREQGK